MNILPRRELRSFLAAYQRRLRAGDGLPTLTEVASRAGLHRDTVYAFLQGDRINIGSQLALSRVVMELQQEILGKPETRLASIALTDSGPRLTFGLTGQLVLKRS